ncbi:hypothetical protein ACIBEJ_24615 [Nonomuraea sp. NPDC050790]|uniref:hypothetical protein n=1 Tax=Nonomuraea sp. NPDC050790 TaxID=3364371 RepID=UPI00379AF717
MTRADGGHPDDDDDYPPIDARHGRGFMFHWGVGDNNLINHNYAAPTSEEDLRRLRFRNLKEAYCRFQRLEEERQADLLSSYERAGELANLLCEKSGVDWCVQVLYKVPGASLVRLIGELTPANRNAVSERLAVQLARDPGDAKLWLREFAQAHPVGAAWLLARIARLDFAPPERRVQRAVWLLPDHEFVLKLPDDVAARLLITLLFPYANSPSVPTQAAELLEKLISSDVEQTARVTAAMNAAAPVAACVRRLRLESGALLLGELAVLAPETYETVLLRELPKPMATALQGKIASGKRLGPVFNQRWTSGWPWIDATLAVLSYLGSAADRRSSKTSSLKAEARHSQEVWRAARSTVKNANHYRIQRNQLAVAAVALLIALVLALVLA